MPRRKRKSIDARKVPLEFQQSPFSGPYHPLSPVFCSDNPATANVVQVREDLQVPWVSPQFSNAPNSLTTAKKGRRSRRLANKTVDVNSTTLVTPNHRTRKKVHSKLVPLQFQGDKTPEPPSIIEEVSYDENTPPFGELLASPRGVKGRSSHERYPGTCEQYKEDIVQPSVKCDPIQLANQRESILSHIPVTKTKTGKKEAVRRKVRPPRLKINLDDLFSDDSDISLLAAHERDTGDSLKNRSLREMNGVFNRKSLESSPTPQTPKASLTQENAVAENCQKSLCDTDMGVSLDIEEDFPYKTQGRDSLSSLRLNLSTPTSTALSDKHHCQSDRLKYGSFLTPDRKRRSLRLVNMFLPSTPVQAHTMPQSHNILAYDTPEEDYGLPVRKRYLKLKGIKPLKMRRLKHFTSK